MVIETVVFLTLGWATAQFASTTHTKLSSINKKQVVQVNSQIKLIIKIVVIEEEEVIEPDAEDGGWDDTPYIRESGTKTVKELKAYARELGVKGYSKLNKSDLQSFLVEHLQNV